MFGPIFTRELRRIVGNNWFLCIRILYAVIVLLFFLAWITETQNLLYSSAYRRSLRAFLWQTQGVGDSLGLAHFGVIFFLTPVFAVGSFLQEKKQRTLELLLTTQQRSADIVLGHWLAALAKVLILTSPVVPLLLWSHATLGTPWWKIVTWIGCTWLGALPLAAWPLLTAVWMRRVPSALLAAYLGNALLLAIIPLLFTDAQLALWSHAVYDAKFWCQFALFIGIPTIACLSVAVHQLRPAQSADRHSKPIESKAGQRPPVGDEPFFWKEYHRFLLMPRALRFVPSWCWLGSIAVVIGGIASFAPIHDALFVLIWVVLVVIFPFAALEFAGDIVRTERQAFTWDSLCMTPLRADEFVEQCLRAVARRVQPYWFAVLPAIVILLVKQWQLGIFVLICWLVARVNIPLAAAAGLHSSVYVRSYLGSLLYAMVAFTAPAFCIVLSSFLLTWMLLIGIAVGVFGPFPFSSDWENQIVAIIATSILSAGVFLVSMQWMVSQLSTAHVATTIKLLAKKEGLALPGT